LEAKVTLEYQDAKTAEAIAKAVSPDNLKTPSDLIVKTTNEGKKVISQIKYRGKLQTFTATLDDLLFCISTAEKTLQTTKKIKKKTQITGH
jgi:hypothetical protein